MASDSAFASIRAPDRSLIGCFVLFPLVSAASSYYGTRTLSLIVFLLEGLTVFIVVAEGRAFIDDTTLTILVASLSLSLLLSTQMISNDLSGYDIHQEFYQFQEVLHKGTWDPTGGMLYGPAISISILPSIITIVSGLDGVLVFRCLYPTLFALAPVVLYRIFRKMLSPKPAFLSVFLFMFYPTFYVEMAQLGRQEIAELLMVCVFLIFFSTAVQKRAGAFAVILLTFGIITAHYSLAYIYMVVVGFSLLSSSISRRVVGVTNLMMTCLSLVILLLWYVYVTGGSAVRFFESFLSFTINGLMRDFFNPAARPVLVLQAAGLESVTPGFLHDAYRVTQYAVQIALVVGFIAFLRKKGKNLAEKKMLPLMSMSLIFLAFAVILPYFARTLNLSRFYHITLLFSSPCFAYGTKQFYAGFRKIFMPLSKGSMGVHSPSPARWSFAAAILFSYLLFTSGWVWAVAMDRPTSFLFDKQRMLTSSDSSLWVSYFERYTMIQDIYAVHWMGSYLPKNNTLCGDFISRYHVLFSYAGRPPSDNSVNLLACNFKQSYTYLNALNTLYGIGTDSSGESPAYPLSGIVTKLTVENRIFSNGAATITGN